MLSCIFIHSKSNSHIPMCTFLNFSFDLYTFYADFNIPGYDHKPKYSSTSSFRFLTCIIISICSPHDITSDSLVHQQFIKQSNVIKFQHIIWILSDIWSVFYKNILPLSLLFQYLYLYQQGLKTICKIKLYFILPFPEWGRRKNPGIYPILWKKMYC